jgi:hypothetical protein
MRLFGRPDISVRQVPDHRLLMAAELSNRFIEMLAFSHVTPEGKPSAWQGCQSGWSVAIGETWTTRISTT